MLASEATAALWPGGGLTGQHPWRDDPPLPPSYSWEEHPQTAQLSTHSPVTREPALGSKTACLKSQGSKVSPGGVPL